MIADLRTASDLPDLSCDLCIVGTGAAGLAIASEMNASPYRVVLIESGGTEHEEATQALYDVDVSGLPYPGATEGRFRVVGGSTTKWGGQGLPLMPSDFERREWVPHSGWPVTFDEINPFYSRAARFMLLDGMGFDDELFRHLRTSRGAFDADRMWHHFAKWSPQPSLRDHYWADIAASDRCTVLLHANVTGIILGNEQDRIESINVRSLEGHTTTVRARIFVLCTGGIETPRLLLANNRQRPDGIGNEHDLVGRFYQDHPTALVGCVNSRDPAGVQKLFNVYHKGGLKYSVRCTATSRWQSENRALNASMMINFSESDQPLPDLKEAYWALRRRDFSPAVFRQILRLAAHPRTAVTPVWHYFVNGRSFSPGARLRVAIMTEQEPNPESRILLSSRKDALGIPLAKVRWLLTDLTRHTLRRFGESLRAEFQRLGIGNIELHSWLLNDSRDWLDHMGDSYHHIGGTRMHDSPEQGVVDRNCRVHSVTNLYIGGSSVFPTGGHSNPTLTIIALCMRLADRLKQELIAV